MIRIATNVDTVIKKLRRYRNNLPAKIRSFLERLAEVGIDTASVKFQSASYDGDNDVKMTGPEWVSDNTLQIAASGKTVLFIEFGSGLLGYGHPRAAEFGYGPGTWSDNEGLGGKHHWADPGGWYYKHDEKSHGNPPAYAMYDAGKEMRMKIEEIAREVFARD